MRIHISLLALLAATSLIACSGAETETKPTPAAKTKAAVASTVTLDDVLAHPRRANCLLYTSPSPRDATLSRMPSSA